MLFLLYPAIQILTVIAYKKLALVTLFLCIITYIDGMLKKMLIHVDDVKNHKYSMVYHTSFKQQNMISFLLLLFG